MKLTDLRGDDDRDPAYRATTSWSALRPPAQVWQARRTRAQRRAA